MEPWPCSAGGGGGGGPVGGCRVRLAWARWRDAPRRLERPARLPRPRSEACCACATTTDVKPADDFFFDQQAPCAFARPIVALLAPGKLRAALRARAPWPFRDELAYLGPSDERAWRLAACRLRRREEEARPEKRAPGRRSSGRRGAGARPGLFACVSVSFVAVTAVGLCLSTMPDIRAEEERGECSPKCRSLFVLETVCVAWFSFEFLLRSLQAESKCAFLRAPLNIIDILALLPFYVSLLLGLAAGPGGTKLLERAGLVLRLLRALRVLYVMRLARHSLGLRSLGLTVRRCAREFGLLLLFLCVAMALFAPLVHLHLAGAAGARRRLLQRARQSWCVISMDHRGLGDSGSAACPGRWWALSSSSAGSCSWPSRYLLFHLLALLSELKSLREDSTRSATATEDSSQGPDGVGQAADSADALWVRAER
uniref:Potassium voltage-gated channel modifier subfamily G member 2 n=1 Tax=Rhinopithecus bieti TaxID=61621 RepID=A0A2K6JTW9_RHIBE